MRLVDVDAEIEKIQAEIRRAKERIDKWKTRIGDTSYHDVEKKIEEQKRNIADARREIMLLKRYGEDGFKNGKNEFEEKRGCKNCEYYGRVGDASKEVEEDCLYFMLESGSDRLPCDFEEDELL